MSKLLLNKTKLTVTVNIISRENVRHEFDAVYIAWRDFNFLLSLGEACKFWKFAKLHWPRFFDLNLSTRWIFIAAQLGILRTFENLCLVVLANLGENLGKRVSENLG